MTLHGMRRVIPVDAGRPAVFANPRTWGWITRIIAIVQLLAASRNTGG
jgi:hypothetical protein